MSNSLKKISNLFILLILKLKIIFNTTSKKAFIFGSPHHSNMGDQAQSYCTIRWINKNYPDHKIFLFETLLCSIHNFDLLRYISKKVKKEDLIILHSGYHTTDLYPDEDNMQKNAIKIFSNHKLIILPQTVNYNSEENLELSSNIFNSHSKLLFFARDEISYNIAKKNFTNCHTFLFPDIVTTMIGTKKFINKRSGILLCLRNDQESFYSKEIIDNLINELKDIDSVSITDTTISLPFNKIKNNREKILDSIWNEYSKYKVIITDRYHGTIFSLISNTPVIVISSKDHKLSSGVKWFPEEFSNYIKYISALDNICDEVKKIMDTDYDYNLPDYFNENYYNKLKGIIDDYD